MKITEFRVSFQVVDDSYVRLPCVALVSLDDINAVLPLVALLYLLDLHTHDTIKPSPPGFTPHFVIFTPDDGIVYFLIWLMRCALITYNSVVLIKNGKLLHQWRTHVWRHLSNHTNIPWKATRSLHDIRSRDAGRQRCCLQVAHRIPVQPPRRWRLVLEWFGALRCSVAARNM